MKHRKGKIITTPKTCSTKSIEPTLSSIQADEKKRNRGEITRDQLMLEQAALATSPRVQNEPKESNYFKYAKCEYATHSAHEFKSPTTTEACNP